MPLEIAPRITVDPSVRSGRPVIAGTRVPVETVVGKLAGGMNAQEVADEYAITMDDVLAARLDTEKAVLDSIEHLFYH